MSGEIAGALEDGAALLPGATARTASEESFPPVGPLAALLALETSLRAGALAGSPRGQASTRMRMARKAAAAARRVPRRFTAEFQTPCRRNQGRGGSGTTTSPRCGW